MIHGACSLLQPALRVRRIHCTAVPGRAVPVADSPVLSVQMQKKDTAARPHRIHAAAAIRIQRTVPREPHRSPQTRTRTTTLEFSLQRAIIGM
eukprot:COSAG01_NODE_897_length_12874_cov_17.636115_12_plen_93_part_00